MVMLCANSAGEPVHLVRPVGYAPAVGRVAAVVLTTLRAPCVVTG